jgi:hypothetical protein
MQKRRQSGIPAPRSAVLALGVFSAPAAADESGYLNALEPEYPFLAADQLSSEGHQVCGFIRAGNLSADAVVLAQSDLGASAPVALDIVMSAARHLGC